MKIVVVSSGSVGNCTYLEANGTKIIIDTGRSYKITKERLNEQGIELKDIDAIFITHEHNDHVGHLNRFLKLTNAKLYINEESYEEIQKKDKNIAVYPHIFIEKEKRYDVGAFSLVPLEMSHDTVRCFGFLVKELNTNESFGIITDTGYLYEKYFNLLSKIKILVFESNHDVEMLTNSERPYFLIERILSRNGHLSNKECNNYLKKFISEDNKLIILGHLSKQCNSVEIVKKEIENNFGSNPPFSLKIVGYGEGLELINSEDY